MTTSSARTWLRFYERGHAAEKRTAARSAGRSPDAGRRLAMLVAALSLWTAIPLTWIYIGSMLSDTQFPSGGPYMLVFVGIVISILIIAWLLGRLNGLYVRITGTNTVSPDQAGLAEEHARRPPRHRAHDGAGGRDRRLGDHRCAGDDAGSSSWQAHRCRTSRRGSNINTCWLGVEGSAGSPGCGRFCPV